MMNLSCLNVTFRRIGGMTGEATRVDCPLTATFRRIGGMKASFGLVCGTDFGEEDVLWASDKMVLTVEGNKIYVTI